MKAFSLANLLSSGLAAASAIMVLDCVTPQESICDACAVAITVKVLNLDQLASGTHIAARLVENREPQQVLFDTTDHLFKIQADPGRYLISVIANEDSLESPETISVKAINSHGCILNNTANIELEVETSPTGLDSLRIIARSNAPHC
jgi:hypothetical protein